VAPLALVIDTRASRLTQPQKRIYLKLACLMGMKLLLETSSLFRGFVEENAHRKLASHSSLLREFVLSALFCLRC